ncbi:hypothetical protein BVC80_1101g15 [Macleaya cordata]|uniref:Uncharacterized protein n=1 Tax=Macleaya cordata TaxID=56857 RepID=A0A200QCL7_MACCD|nr:hypothetical protein BVC80_1101g15 [Macleaya cordata]
MKGTVPLPVDRMKVELLCDKMILQVSDILIESGELDKIRPEYEASLEINCSQDKLFSVTIPFLVAPGCLHHVRDLSLQLEKHLLPGDVIEVLLLEMLDGYGNHVEKGLEVQLNVDGFCFQDRIGPKREVDDQGCINLNGKLKAVGSYGNIVSFSVEYAGKLIFKKEFQVDQRELRVMSTLPECCAAGSQLENIVFEIVDSDGTVDETIHDDANFGQSHTLTITSESSKIDDCFRYTFRHGRCTVPFISIPREPGIFSVVAAHSCHTELFMVVKVNVMQAPKLEGSSTEHHDVLSQCPVGGMLLLNKSSFCVSKHLRTLVETIINDLKELEDDVARVALLIGDQERKLKMLSEKKAAIEKGISNLQASIEHQSISQLDSLLIDKEVIVKGIEGKGDTAASILCNIPVATQSQVSHTQFLQDVVGIVALLGTVSSTNLSRILAEYLGKEHMLAIVCKSYAAASALECYEKNGQIDHDHALHSVASSVGKSINGSFLVICLEEISPYTGRFKSDDPQKKLALEDPLLPTGKIPPGFLGYAVNLINLDVHHLHTRTAKGHGLRETLFYLLLGDLQVYGTREQMKQALAYIKHGAISLDGGIMKGNGILCLGHREPEVRFPVLTSEAQRRISPYMIDILKQIEDKNLELGAICDEITKESNDHIKAMKRFKKKKERLQRYMEEKGPFLSGKYFEETSEEKKSS